MALLARAPATVANLGPGFDSLALALDLWNEVRVDLDAEPAVEVRGEGEGELPSDASNLVVTTMRSVMEGSGSSLPPMRVSCTNRIPLERGLGSSAAAVVTGLLLGHRLLGEPWEPDRLLRMAVDVEGHADNVAACLRGGAVVAYRSGSGWQAAPISIHPDLRPVALVPEHERLPTADARLALPRDVPLEDAAFNAGRSALAVLALSERPDLLEVALDDRLHQERRLSMVPASRALFDELREAGIPVCVAGAGPSLLAFERDEQLVPEPGPGWRALRVQTAGRGADVREGD